MWFVLAAAAQDTPEEPIETPPPIEEPAPAPADPAPVTASDEPAPLTTSVAVPTEHEDSIFKVGIGVFFNAGGAFMTQPKDLSHPTFVTSLPYSGMAGFCPGAGARLDIRLYDIIGIEAQLIRAWDQAESKYTINGTDIGFKVKQPAWHVPLHLQLGVPSAVLRAYLFGGVDIVIPGESEVPNPAGIPWRMTGGAKTWHMWSFGFGFEARLPIEGVDLRVPIQFRGGATAPYSSVATERATYQVDGTNVLTSMEYDLRWQYYASINIGLSWFFPN